jgi:hypothetical protein
VEASRSIGDQENLSSTEKRKGNRQDHLFVPISLVEVRPSFEDENWDTFSLNQVYNSGVPLHLRPKDKAYLPVGKNPDILSIDHLTPSRAGYDAEEGFHREPGNSLLKNC